MNTQEIAKELAKKFKLQEAEKYDLAYREYDHMVEIIGYVPDPNYDMSDFQGREMLFPKRWVTLGVFPETTEVSL